MTDALDTPAALLAELTARGIALQVHGERIRFRPRKAMTPELVARVAAHKPALSALLAVTKTPAGDSASVGFGGGDAGDVLAATSYPADESRMLADAPAGVRNTVERIKRVFPGAELVGIRKADADHEPQDAPAWAAADSSDGLPP
ncbi:MAG: hypothetical protein KAY37_12055, partial [Phycisphaerae bacterium]|nr:hypothetical protein [Phycisphaerae bacterium]